MSDLGEGGFGAAERSQLQACCNMLVVGIRIFSELWTKIFRGVCLDCGLPGPDTKRLARTFVWIERVGEGRVMHAVDLWAADGIITRAIGEEIRKARRSMGWTRLQLAERMPTDIHIRTLAAYEQGARQCAIVRLVEICLALGVAPTSLLGLALRRAEVDLQTIGMEVDLHAVIHDEQAELEPLRNWARKQLQSKPDGPGVARLNHSVIEGMALLLDFTRSELIQHLSRFTPRVAPPV